MKHQSMPVEVGTPQTPNYVKLKVGSREDYYSVGDLTDEQIEQVILNWADALRTKAKFLREQRRKHG
jgi:hypothetical protein